MQIRYVLQSQQELVTKLDAEKEKTKKISKENTQFRKSFTHRDTPRELFKVPTSLKSLRLNQVV